jgi:tetratricopeptide (TPR) repeat protein
MTVRFLLTRLLPLAAALLVAGCGGEVTTTTPETDDPNYRQGQQLLRQLGRESEALNAFLKVIEARGERAAPESHLEAGRIYLKHIRDPIEAIHHLRLYLQYAPPNSREVKYVRELINTATREFAKTIPGRIQEDQSVRLEVAEEVANLRRENEELRAELATLRGGAAVPITRGPRFITVPKDPPKQLTVETPPVREAEADLFQPAPTSPAPAPVATQQRPTMAPSAAKAPAASRPSGGGRTHTIAPRESLWSIARKYYGDGVGSAKVNGIYEANRDVMRSPTDLKVGATLRIP